MKMNHEQKQALDDYLKVSLEFMKNKKKQRIKKITIIILMFPIFLFILFNNPFTFVFTSKKDLRYYEVYLNNYKLRVSEKIENTVILPHLIEIPNGNSVTFYENNKNTIINKAPYILSIKSYTCFIPSKNRKIKISCNEKSENDINKYENKDTFYTKMQILKYDYESKYEYSVHNEVLSRTYLIHEDAWCTRPFEEYSIIYEGDFIEDITPYISKTSVYVIKLNFQYKTTKGTLSVGVVNDGENVFAL